MPRREGFKNGQSILAHYINENLPRRAVPGFQLELEPMEKHVEELIKKAAEAPQSEDAMRFSQAACNAANAMCALKAAEGN